MNKSKGIVLLGLCPDDVNILRLALLRHEGYEIWTCNDFWTQYPDLIPDRAYQIHKDTQKHIDEFGNERDVAGFNEYCKAKGVDTIITDLSPESYAWYYGKQPKEWYQSSVNYMIVDAWRLIDKGMAGPHIILEGMPFAGGGERTIQRHFAISAVEMSVHRGYTVDAAHWKLWHEEPTTVNWAKMQDVKIYGLTWHDEVSVNKILHDAMSLGADQTEIIEMKGANSEKEI